MRQTNQEATVFLAKTEQTQTTVEKEKTFDKTTNKGDTSSREEIGLEFNKSAKKANLNQFNSLVELDIYENSLDVNVG